MKIDLSFETSTTSPPLNTSGVNPSIKFSPGPIIQSTIKRPGAAYSAYFPGDRVAIGATSNDGNSTGSGHVHVYRLT